MKKATCPHCGKQYNAGAKKCFRCKKFITWRGWVIYNIPPVLIGMIGAATIQLYITWVMGWVTG